MAGSHTSHGGTSASEMDRPVPSTEATPNVDVIAVFGPTASGKSAVAEEVAARLGTEVVSVDALQVYRGLPILTNQPARPTRLVGIRPLAEQMTVGAFAPLAHAEIDAVVSARGVVVVTGGTGLYLRAALADLELPPAVDEKVQARVVRAVDEDRTAAHARLATLDPDAADAVHPNDRQRLVRALALAESGASLARAEDRLWTGGTRRPTMVFGLELGREALERRIRRRTEEMFARGVVDEVRAALRGPLSRTVEKTLGLREIASLEPEEALERIVVRTRRYAAYQRKWMRRIPNIELLDGERDPAVIAGEIMSAIVWMVDR
jgi:tRNA dimethylallyltransferase